MRNGKTYSVCTETTINGESIWMTNWHQYQSVDDIDWDKVKNFCQEKGCTGYGYVYGRNSRDIISDRNRTVLWQGELAEGSIN